MTITTSATVSISSNSTSSTEARMVMVRSVSIVHLHRRRQATPASCGSSALDAVDDRDDVGARLPLDVDDHRRLSVHPRRLLRRSPAPSTTVATSDSAHRRAVAVGDDQRLVVAAARAAGRWRRSCRPAAGRRSCPWPGRRWPPRSPCAGPPASARTTRAASGLAWMRTAGFWPPLMLTRPTPGSCEIFCARRVSARSSTWSSGSSFGGQRQRQNRRVGRIDLAVDGRVRADPSADKSPPR